MTDYSEIEEILNSEKFKNIMPAESLEKLKGFLLTPQGRVEFCKMVDMLKQLFYPTTPSPQLYDYIDGVKVPVENPEITEIKGKVSDAFKTFSDIVKTEPLPLYEGECGFKLQKFEDPIAQTFLNKHLPRGLNQHATDVTNIFNRLTFKQLQETNDGYLMRGLLSDPILWLFMVKDADFQAFMRKDMGEKSTQEYIDYLVTDMFGEKYREIITYCFS